MIAGIAGLARRRAPRVLIALGLSALAGMGAALAQEPAGPPAASAAPFSALPPVLEKQYRTVRSLVVTRGACVRGVSCAVRTCGSAVGMTLR